MPQDAFTLRHIARELDEQLRGGKVNKIIQPSRDEIDILLYAGGKTKKLVLNTNASFARAILSDIPRTAPDVAPNFCMLLRKYITGA
ncbi:MAG: fibronectin/fibrinogen-binding protein, partial [Bacillota bacterium]